MTLTLIKAKNFVSIRVTFAIFNFLPLFYTSLYTRNRFRQRPDNNRSYNLPVIPYLRVRIISLMILPLNIETNKKLVKNISLSLKMFSIIKRSTDHN